jgi:ABC-type uncharacterized transport system ATPase subunit
MAGTRARNPRRIVVEDLRLMKRWIEVMVTKWSQAPSTKWYDANDGKGYTYHRLEDRRKRADIPASEYPENRITDWYKTAEFMQAVQIQARKIEEFAHARIRELEAATNGGQR